MAEVRLAVTKRGDEGRERDGRGKENRKKEGESVI